MMKTNILLVSGLALTLLSGCAQISPIAKTRNNEDSAELHSIDPNNHNAVAKHYEDMANEMKLKLRTKKKLLAEYEEYSYYYGRKGQNLQSHTTANIRYLENSIKENMKQAAIHRKMALDEQKRSLSFFNE
ncbi:hypothetical protein [Nitrosomonas communis]|nr:hypothetical protein [Nitrosomonas communis]